VAGKSPLLYHPPEQPPTPIAQTAHEAAVTPLRKTELLCALHEGSKPVSRYGIQIVGLREFQEITVPRWSELRDQLGRFDEQGTSVQRSLRISESREAAFGPSQHHISSYCRRLRFKQLDQTTVFTLS
jgi:hypothetical protein